MENDAADGSTAPGGACTEARVGGCPCRSFRRRGALVLGSLAEGLEPLVEAARDLGWHHDDELGVLELELGRRHGPGDPTELRQLVESLVPTELAAGLRFAWLPAEGGERARTAALLRAGPLAECAPERSSPLLAILRERRIETWYQPIVQAGSGALWGYECLMRGRDADGALVGAGDLLGWARRERLELMLDRVSRETHLRNAGRVGHDGGCHFTVNFLPTAIYDPVFCLKSSFRACREGGLDPSRVFFEVVETDQVKDPEHLRGILQHYRDHGFGVALDDVGSGWAGLGLLADLRPHLVKLDRRLVSQAVGSSIHREVCRSLVEVSRRHDILALAEGVERAAERDLMEELGVDLLQGFLFGRPAPEPQAPSAGA